MLVAVMKLPGPMTWFPMPWTHRRARHHRIPRDRMLSTCRNPGCLFYRPYRFQFFSYLSNVRQNLYTFLDLCVSTEPGGMRVAD